MSFNNDDDSDGLAALFGGVTPQTEPGPRRTAPAAAEPERPATPPPPAPAAAPQHYPGLAPGGDPASAAAPPSVYSAPAYAPPAYVPPADAAPPSFAAPPSYTAPPSYAAPTYEPPASPAYEPPSYAPPPASPAYQMPAPAPQAQPSYDLPAPASAPSSPPSYDLPAPAGAQYPATAFPTSSPEGPAYAPTGSPLPPAFEPPAYEPPAYEPAAYEPPPAYQPPAAYEPPPPAYPSAPDSPTAYPPPADAPQVAPGYGSVDDPPALAEPPRIAEPVGPSYSDQPLVRSEPAVPATIFPPGPLLPSSKAAVETPEDLERSTAGEKVGLVLAILTGPLGLVVAIVNAARSGRRRGWLIGIVRASLVLGVISTIAAGIAGYVLWTVRAEQLQHAEIAAASADFCAAAEADPTMVTPPTLGWPAPGASVSESLTLMQAWTDRWTTLAESSPADLRAGMELLAERGQTIIDAVTAARTVDDAANQTQIASAEAQSGVADWYTTYCLEP